MIHKTKGIVLGLNKYSDRFSIAQVFTADFGKTSYMVPLSKGKRSKINRALFSPLSIIDMEVEHVPLRQLHRLKEVRRRYPLYNINVDVVKLSIVLFISEFLSKVLQETVENSHSTYQFIESSIMILEEKEGGLANFHLVFMFLLSQLLGVTPNLNDYTARSYFDLMNGEFTQSKPLHTHYLDYNQSRFLYNFRRVAYYNMHLFRLSKNDRNEIVDRMVDYYRLHVYEFGEIKALEVLRSLF